MDENGNIYRAPEDEIPKADKERFETLLEEYLGDVGSMLEKLAKEAEDKVEKDAVNQ